MTINWQPQWTTQVKIESGGRYALGLNKFHDGLEDILVKGVIGAANRLRYITYCCWAIGDIETNEKCRDYSEFVDAFTRRENSLALGLYMLKPSYTVHGSNTMSRIVKDNVKDYDCTFRMMQSDDLGAYGLYYAGTIYKWGLTESDEKGLIRLTKAGKELYEIITQHYRKVQPDYYKRYKGKKSVPVKALLQWAEINDFDNIRRSTHKEEREFFKSVIFRLGKKKADDYRRDTFAFFLECIERCVKTNNMFNEDILRNIYYYSSFYNSESSKIRAFQVPKYFNDVHFYWSIYEGHVYFRWWLSKYFQVFLDHLKSCDNGSTADEFFAKVDLREFNDVIFHFSNKKRRFFDAPMQAVLDLLPKPASLPDDISEESITDDQEYESLSGVLAKFVLIMANLFVKFKGVRSDRWYQFLIANLGTDLWFEVLFRFSNLGQIPVREFLKTMLKKYIIDQHDLIMIEKKDLRRCWFTSENKRYFHQADESPIWRPAKYQTIMNFLSDMNLIDSSKGMVRLSREGTSFFQNLKRDYY